MIRPRSVTQERYPANPPDGLPIQAHFANTTIFREPGTLFHHDDALCVVASGRIDNRRELLDGLSQAPIANDAELILAVYRRWGTDCAGFLIGDFAFCIVDEGSDRLIAACDPMNMRPLYHGQQADRLSIGTRVEDVADALGRRARLDRAMACLWLAGHPDPGASMFAEVERLRPGHRMLVTAHQRSITRFWDLNPDHRIRHPSTDGYAEELESLLARCVVDRLPADGTPVASQLSGGMDSTSITALAWRAVGRDADGLIAVSHTYPDCPACDEQDRIAATAHHLGLRQHLLIPTPSDIEQDYRSLYPPTFDSPGTVISPRYLDELARIHDTGARVLLTGSGGDEMTWGHSLSYSQRLLRGEVGVIGEVLRGSRELGLPQLATLLQLFVRPLLPEWLLRLRRRLRGHADWPDWIPPRAAREFDLTERLRPPPPRFDNPALQARYEALFGSSTYHSVRSYEAAGDARGVEVRHPFFDRRLAEFSFAIPDDLWLRQRYPKWLLRTAMRGLLPDAVLWNRHKVVFDHFFARLIERQRETIFAILSHPGLADLGLVDNQRLLAAFRAMLSADPPTITVELLHALMMQIWFQRHRDLLSY